MQQEQEKDLSQLTRRAIGLVQAGMLSDARVILEELLISQPDSCQLWKTLGLVYQLLERYPEAASAFWAAHKLDTEDLEARQLHHESLAYFTCHPVHHPEAIALYGLCQGRGIEVGCGHRKTHPDVIGVDLLAGGVKGEHGVVQDQVSVADVCASGDDLHMFQEGELDYVISRHVLEHFQDPLKALEEWKRVLKPGGLLGVVVPDDSNCDTIALDPTHKHVFTPDSFRRLMHYLGGFDECYVGICLYHYSFVAVFQKKSDQGEKLNYLELLARKAAERSRQQAVEKERKDGAGSATEIWKEVERLGGIV